MTSGEPVAPFSGEPKTRLQCTQYDTEDTLEVEKIAEGIVRTSFDAIYLDTNLVCGVLPET